jgi:hypothetical protein
MSQILYVSMEKHKHADEPLTVFITKARDEALPALLLVLHRAHENGHALRLVVQWAKRRPNVDLTATYTRLREHLANRRSFIVPDLCVAMTMQGARGLGARDRETSADLVWTALHEEHFFAGSMLSGFRPREGDAFPGKTTTTFSDDRPAYYQWCIAHLAARNFAAVALAVSAHRFMEVSGNADGSLSLSREKREADAYIHTLYREIRETLPAAWQEAPPLIPMEALARARRACWFLEYAYTASCPSAQSLACDAAFARDKDTSIWGFQWIDDRALVAENRLFDALFSIDLRLRPPGGVLQPLEFGHLLLTHEVTLV